MWLFDIILNGWTAFTQILERIILRRGHRVLGTEDDSESLDSDFVLDEYQDDNEPLRVVPPIPIAHDENEEYVHFCDRDGPVVL
jgi:hypothetical protein